MAGSVAQRCTTGTTCQPCRESAGAMASVISIGRSARTARAPAESPGASSCPTSLPIEGSAGSVPPALTALSGARAGDARGAHRGRIGIARSARNGAAQTYGQYGPAECCQRMRARTSRASGTRLPPLPGSARPRRVRVVGRRRITHRRVGRPRIGRFRVGRHGVGRPRVGRRGGVQDLAQARPVLSRQVGEDGQPAPPGDGVERSASTNQARERGVRARLHLSDGSCPIWRA